MSGTFPDILTMRAGIERLTSLLSLTLWITLIPVDDTIHISQWCANIGILRVPVVRSIRTLAYAIVVDNSDYATSMERVKRTPWQSLPSILENFPDLQNVVVAIYEASGRRSIGDEIWELVYSSLLPLKERGVRLKRTSAPLL